MIQCLYAFSNNVMKIKNHHDKNPDIFASYIFEGPATKKITFFAASLNNDINRCQAPELLEQEIW